MFINLTPHDVTIRRVDGSEVTYPPAGPVPRVQETKEEIAVVDGVPFVRVRYGQVDGLPSPMDGAYLIVSTLIRQALPERQDLVSPGDSIRNEDGLIVGCRALYSNG